MLQPPKPADASFIAAPTDPIAPLRAALRGHYDIEREIGQGAFATVYLARDLKHERKVAVKVLHADPTSETGELRFIREIRLLARLQHPNILPLHDSGHVEELLYYVMPYVSGETLRGRIDRERQLTIEDATCIAQETADALACAHGQGIIHRDIKPENILISGGHAIVADFGIARLIDLAGIRQLTRTGLGSPGTPQYMAPEQLLGERQIDARADIYSVGCVLYEMLTGKTPFAGKEGFVKRFTEAPPSPSSIRPAIPDWLDSIVSTTLARNPADRYSTAGQLARALTLGLARERTTPARSQTVGDTPGDVVEAEIPSLRRGQSPAADARGNAEAASVADSGDKSGNRHISLVPGWARSRPRTVVAIGIASIALAALGAVVRPNALKAAFGRFPTPDSSRYVILPIASSSPGSDRIASTAADKLYAAFRAWEGLNLVPDLTVNETIQETGRSPRTLNDALSFARRYGAGQLVWGHVVRVGDSVRPRVELYDLRRPNSSVKELVLADDRTETYATVAAALLARANRPPAAVGGDRQTHNYAAWDAYNRGHIALANWNLAEARAEFARGVNTDPQFPSARLWLGQIEEWLNPTAPDGWRDNIERAAAAANGMTDRDRLLSVALTALANKQYPAACTAYHQLTQLDSLDFIGWYGLGECQGLDGVVLPDPSSPSGWRWRSSYDAAVRSFTRALRLNPGAHALLSFPRLRRLLPTTAVNPRLDDRATPTFAAFPSLSTADTLEFVPYPISTFRKGLPPSATLTLNQALSRDLDVLVDIVNNWIRVSPSSPDAYESLSDVLETRGDIADGTNPALSAPAAARKALSLSGDSQQRLRLAVREARLRFRRGDYASPRRTADSLLTAGTPDDTNDPPVFISLTALAGKIKATSDQAKAVLIPQELQGITLSASLRAVAGELFANAALGVCGDTLSALRNNLEQEIQSSIAEEQRNTVRTALLSRPLSMMVPCTSGASALDFPSRSGAFANLQQAFARRNLRDIDRSFQAIAQARRAYRPSDVSLERSYQEAWIRAATGDTAGAITQLDQSLKAIPSMSAGALREAGTAAAAGRAMVLRADLAQSRGDSRTAYRWALAASELWAEADPALQQTVSRMRALAAQSK